MMRSCPIFARWKKPPLPSALLICIPRERGREARKEAAMVQEAYMKEMLDQERRKDKKNQRMESDLLAEMEAAMVQLQVQGKTGQQ